MPNTNPSPAELERLMEAARDARSAALVARCTSLFSRLRSVLRIFSANGRRYPA